MTLHQFGQWHSITLTPAKFFKALFGQIDILEIIDMFEEGLAGIKAFAAASAPGKVIEPRFDIRRQPQNQHDFSPVYYINAASEVLDLQCFFTTEKSKRV